MAYVLEMLPYPSGEPHIGHLKNYLWAMRSRTSAARATRCCIRWATTPSASPPRTTRSRPDSIPASPSESPSASSRSSFGAGASRSTGRASSAPTSRAYRWTQWLFLRLFERGLAYRKEAVNWCPKDATVLANEQVIDGRCERCGTVVEIRQLEQWFFRITDYADRLLEDLKTVSWPPHVVAMQENWIGRSEGAEVVFRCEELAIDYPVFTTRPDTLFGATFFVMAPEHPDVFRLNDSPRCTSTSTARCVRRRSAATSSARRPAWRSAARC